MSKIFSHPINILLVDDETEFVEVMSKRLKKRNMNVTKAHSGSEGIRTLKKNDFDVAIVDLKMEDMDGLEVLKIFKKMSPEMPVIILTGHGSEENARLGLKLGAFDYLIKPYGFNELINKICIAASKKTGGTNGSY